MKLIHVQFVPDAENPSELGDNWKLHSFSSRHINYTPPEKLRLRLTSRNTEPVVRCVGLRRKLDVGLAFWVSYYQHGDCAWFLLGNNPPGTEMVWDGVRFAGLLVWPHSPESLGVTTRTERAAAAADFLRHYTAWCNNALMEFSIRDIDDPDGLRGDVEWSIPHYDEDAMVDDLAVSLALHEEITVTGEAAAYLDLTRLKKARERLQSIHAPTLDSACCLR